MEESKFLTPVQKLIHACEDVVNLITENLVAVACGEEPKHKIDAETKKFVLSVIEKRSNYENFDKAASKVKGEEVIEEPDDEKKSVSVTTTFSGNFFEAVSEKVKTK